MTGNTNGTSATARMIAVVKYVLSLKADKTEIPEGLPSGGTTGDFLRKDSNGAAWETVQTWQGGSY